MNRLPGPAKHTKGFLFGIHLTEQFTQPLPAFLPSLLTTVVSSFSGLEELILVLCHHLAQDYAVNL